MDQFLRLDILFGFHRSENLEWKRDSRIVELLRSDIDGTGTTPDLDPVLPEAGVCQNINESWSFHFVDGLSQVTTFPSIIEVKGII